MNPLPVYFVRQSFLGVFMDYQIFVEKQPHNGFVVTALGWPDCVATAATKRRSGYQCLPRCGEPPSPQHRIAAVRGGNVAAETFLKVFTDYQISLTFRS